MEFKKKILPINDGRSLGLKEQREEKRGVTFDFCKDL